MAVVQHAVGHVEGRQHLAEVLEGYETLKRLASSRNHIVPGHDPAVMKIYPAASEALKGLVIRLDVDPKV